MGSAAISALHAAPYVPYTLGTPYGPLDACPFGRAPRYGNHETICPPAGRHDTSRDGPGPPVKREDLLGLAFDQALNEVLGWHTSGHTGQKHEPGRPNTRAVTN